MSRAVAIGEQRLLEGFGLVGVELVPAEGPAQARAAWEALEAEVALVLLTPAAQRALAPALDAESERIWAVVPA